MKAISVPRALRALPLFEVFQSTKSSVLRNTLFFTIAGTAVAALVLTLPVNAYYATVDYSRSDFDIEVIGVLNAAQVAGLESVSEPGSVVPFASVGPAEIKAGDATASPVTIYFTDQPERLNQSWFADSTVIQSGKADKNWIDISADVAHALHARPGDVVDIPFAKGVYRAQVRRVMAVARNGIPLTAAGPLTAEVDEYLTPPPGGRYTSALLSSSRPVSEIERAVQGGLKSGDILVRSRQEALREADLDPAKRPPIVVAITLLGFALMLGLAVREGAALIRRRGRDLTVLVALGATRRSVTAALSLIEGAGIVVAMFLTYYAVVHIMYQGLFANALPPEMKLPLALVLSLTALAYTGLLILASTRKLHTANLVPDMLQGTAL